MGGVGQLGGHPCPLEIHSYQLLLLGFPGTEIPGSGVLTGLVRGLTHTEGAQYDTGKDEGCQWVAMRQLCLLLEVVQDIKDLDIGDLKEKKFVSSFLMWLVSLPSSGSPRGAVGNAAPWGFLCTLGCDRLLSVCTA